MIRESCLEIKVFYTNNKIIEGFKFMLMIKYFRSMFILLFQKRFPLIVEIIFISFVGNQFFTIYLRDYFPFATQMNVMVKVKKWRSVTTLYIKKYYWATFDCACKNPFTELDKYFKQQTKPTFTFTFLNEVNVNLSWRDFNMTL